MEAHENGLDMYDMSICLRVRWDAHSLSNAGSNGSNRLMTRQVTLADGTVVDACSGNILKHYHDRHFADLCASEGISLCEACAVGDGRRAAALVHLPEYSDSSVHEFIRKCAVCDTHGFLITGKRHVGEDSSVSRLRLSKHSLIKFSFALALPDHQHISEQLLTRIGDSKEAGQMLMKMPARSATYALCIRYRCVGVGVDTNTWSVALNDETERERRHRAILAALREQLLSPDGAQTSRSLPHLAGLTGAIVIRTTVGRAPMYSPLEDDFVDQLNAMSSKTCHIRGFDSAAQFHEVMESLITTSRPAKPAPRDVQMTLR